MRKIGLLLAGLLLLLSASILAYVPSGFARWPLRQNKPDSQKFYALRVVSEREVQNTKDSLSAPDGNYAEILPGGQLVVLMEDILLPSLISGWGENPVCVDSGSIVGKGGMDFGLEGRFIWQDTQGEQHHEWIPLGPTATGFCLSPPPVAICSLKDASGVDLVRITNPGSESLFVDAVIGYVHEIYQVPEFLQATIIDLH